MEDIRIRLSQFKERSARLSIVCEQIERLKEEIARAELDTPTMPHEPVLVYGLSSPRFDPLPRAQKIYGNNEGGQEFDSVEVKTLRRKLAAAYAEEKELADWISEIRIALDSLDEKTKLIIELSCIEKLNYERVAERIDEKYGIFPCERTVRYHRKSGLQQMGRILGCGKMAYEA